MFREREKRCSNKKIVTKSISKYIIFKFKYSTNFKIGVLLPTYSNNIYMICSRKIKMKSSWVVLMKALKINYTWELCFFWIEKQTLQKHAKALNISPKYNSFLWKIKSSYTEMNLRTEYSWQFKVLCSQICYSFPWVTISDWPKDRTKFELKRRHLCNKKPIKFKDYMENMFGGKPCLVL